MPSRRAFIHGGLAASALAATPLGSTIAFARLFFFRVSSRSTDTVVVDETLSQSAAFGAATARRGTAVHTFAGDIGRLWMTVIEPRWKTRPSRIAGLTSGPALFCLELLARDYGMRLVYRIEHAIVDRAMRHTVSAADDLSTWEGALDAAGKHWPDQAAALSVTYPAHLHGRGCVELLDLAARRGAPGDSVYSWLIAPVSPVNAVAAQAQAHAAGSRPAHI